LSAQEVALDEDPDNREAEHAVNRLASQISSDLFDRLKSIYSALLVVLSGSIETYEEVFWQKLVENDINPRAITVFISHIAKVSNNRYIAL
jgi:hypothetical protein